MWSDRTSADPLDNSLAHFTEKAVARDLIAVQVVLEQLGIIVGHFLEVGDAPALVDRIAMESAGDLVIDSALGHCFERRLGYVQQFFVARGLVTLQQQIRRAGVRELRRVAEASVTFIEQMQRRFDHGIHYAGIEFAASGVKHFGFRHCLLECFRGTVHFGTARFESVSNSQQDAFEAGAAHGVFRREIRAAKKWLTIGSQKRSEWPTALPGNRADCRLVAGVNVRTLVAIDLHGNVELIDHRGDFGIFVTLAIDYMAPMAPHRANVQ